MMIVRLPCAITPVIWLFCVLLPSSTDDIDMYSIGNTHYVGTNTTQPPTMPCNNSLLLPQQQTYYTIVYFLALLALSYCLLKLKYQCFCAVMYCYTKCCTCVIFIDEDVYLKYGISCHEITGSWHQCSPVPIDYLLCACHPLLWHVHKFH